MNPLTLMLGVAVLVAAWSGHGFVPAPYGTWMSVAGTVAGTWVLYCGVMQLGPGRDRPVLRLWGETWTRDEACSHFFITGATGTGKTARAVVPIIHGLRQTLPGTGVLAIDSKGVLWQPLAAIARQLGQESDLRLIRVRPPDIPREQWQAPLRLNVLADRSVPWGTYAKIVVDTATAAGQKGGQSFFKESARDAITHAMQALALIGTPVTLDNVHNVLCVSDDTTWLVDQLTSHESAREELQYFRDFAAQPPEQKGGTVSTVANYLRPYTVPDIAEVFGALEPNFSLGELDQGRLVCLSVPQVYQVERRYLNLLCKQLFFLHAFRRFDLPEAELRRKNVISLVLDEGQKTTLLSEDGFSDHLTVDELREAGVCLISATQTPLSLYAAFENDKKADVFMANLRTQIHFRAADEQGAKILSAKMGGREMRKYSGGVSGGKTSRNWQKTDEPWFKSAQLLALPEGRAVIKHPRRISRPLLRKLPFTSFTRENESTQ
ncbi:MAG TPA: type IV secretion system DNA-binding domain-containing protein [Candidatus Limnocylindria bacterium]|jgi:type IV secretory pathway TraG/TraD family ATPase VirD4|nr:type IV secretion system DNA-binding domain-containing protein [Candidatus Limnocylindria bacterium]